METNTLDLFFKDLLQFVSLFTIFSPPPAPLVLNFRRGPKQLPQHFSSEFSISCVNTSHDSIVTTRPSHGLWKHPGELLPYRWMMERCVFFFVSECWRILQPYKSFSLVWMKGHGDLVWQFLVGWNLFLQIILMNPMTNPSHDFAIFRYLDVSIHFLEMNPLLKWVHVWKLRAAPAYKT